MKLFNYFFKITFVFCLFLGSCKDSQMSRTEADRAANPFSMTQNATQELSELDKAKLAAAIGKTCVDVSPTDLAQKINAAADKLHVFCCWNLQNKQNAASVAALAQDFDSTKIKIHYINIGDANMEQINLSIREHSMADDNFRIANTADLAFLSKLKKEITPNVPLLILVNRSESLLSCYQQNFDKQEMNALLAPLVN